MPKWQETIDGISKRCKCLLEVFLYFVWMRDTHPPPLRLELITEVEGKACSRFPFTYFMRASCDCVSARSLSIFWRQ